MSHSDPLTYLDEVDARVEAATEGPWLPYSTGSSPMDNYVTTPGLDGVAMHYALAWKPGDAEFIAHTRQDLPALSKALRAVLEMHREVRVVVSTSIGAPTYSHGCDFCAPLTGETHYPCPTVQEITAALSAPNDGESND